ncbi:MAG: hypothetical protein NTX32_08030 [Candidatus Firestonebacteria bacterium]|nr:hypothetical protein [Candidatus Firestonebacteria bacterium]
MFESYNEIAQKYKKPSLKYERRLISLAKKGRKSARDELLLYQVGFFLFRVRTMLYPAILMRYGEDIIQECSDLALRKIKTYNLKYRDIKGVLKPVYFRSYIWKGVTGIIVSSIKKKKEIQFTDLSDNYERMI